ncbi:helix-turn-helix domain-containing protein [Sphingomonas sp. RB3P16]|uniref:winged helix-turn-helix transcriptional regulator n=1 Tax=Parasphingomonas frigoris TaxID=3096163 RepID=UPI002FCC3230
MRAILASHQTYAGYPFIDKPCVLAGAEMPIMINPAGKDMIQGPNRYGALKRAVRGVSDKMLIQQLKELEADGVVTRKDHQEVPPRVDYTLTPLGRTLAVALVPLCNWGSDNMAEVTRIFAEREQWHAR